MQQDAAQRLAALLYSRVSNREQGRAKITGMLEN
jgi:hypothetical protein